MNSTYARAYTEVLEILKYLPKEEYNKISKDKIKFYEQNRDIDYVYKFDSSRELTEQNISREANAIILSLFTEFYANELQKEKVEKILRHNEKIYNDKLEEKYNYNEIFNNQEQETIFENTEIIAYKENFFSKIINKIKSIFYKNKM